MIDLRNQWNGTTLSYDVAMMKGDAELAAAIWRNVFAARGEKAYKEKDLSDEHKERLVDERRKHNDPEADGAPLEELPHLIFMYVAHLRRELQRLEMVSDEDVLRAQLTKFGRVGLLGSPEIAELDAEGAKLVGSTTA